MSEHLVDLSNQLPEVTGNGIHSVLNYQVKIEIIYMIPGFITYNGLMKSNRSEDINHNCDICGKKYDMDESLCLLFTNHGVNLLSCYDCAKMIYDQMTDVDARKKIKWNDL